jgi:hypothetical protein
LQPDVEVYVIAVVPVVTPHTVPVVITTVATDILLLVHVPPLKPDTDSGRETSIHTAVAPLITGSALTVMVALPVIVLVQPVVTFFAITVYTPPVVSGPKLSGPPVPGRLSTAAPPTYR